MCSCVQCQNPKSNTEHIKIAIKAALIGISFDDLQLSKDVDEVVVNIIPSQIFNNELIGTECFLPSYNITLSK